MELIALKKKDRKSEPAAKQQSEAKPKIEAKPATKPSAKVEAEPKADAKPVEKATPKVKPQFLALARVAGKLVSESPTKIFIETMDGAKLPIGGFGPKQNMLIRMLAAEPKQDAAVYGLWPGLKGSYTVCSYTDPATFEPAKNTPPIDQMFLEAKLAEISEDSFSVEIGRNRKPRKGQLTKSVFKVDSPPIQGWQAGQWISIQCQRHGEEWRMISNSYAA